MRPYIPPGSRLDVAHVAPTSLARGDVICFISDQGRVTAHRITRIPCRNGQLRIFARGDAQDTEESVPETAFLYIVRRVKAGPFTYRTDSRFGRLLAAAALRSTPGFAALDVMIRQVARIVGFAQSHRPRR